MARIMNEFTKFERKTLRDLAGTVYEAEAHAYLEELEREFARWRSAEILSSELLAAIHEFHQGQSRELWSRYQSLKEPEIVARGVFLGYLAEKQVPEAIRQKLQPLLEFFAKNSR